MTDELDLLEAQGRAEREARKAERKTPEAKAKRNRGRYSRNKGIREERQTEDVLYPYGFIRNPDSGAITGSDYVRPLEDGKRLKHGERKYSKSSSGFKTLYSFLEQSSLNDFVIVRGQGKEPLWIVPEAVMLEVLTEAGYHDFSEETPGYDKWKYRQTKRPSLANHLKKEGAK